VDTLIIGSLIGCFFCAAWCSWAVAMVQRIRRTALDAHKAYLRLAELEEAQAATLELVRKIRSRDAMRAIRDRGSSDEPPTEAPDWRTNPQGAIKFYEERIRRNRDAQFVSHVSPGNRPADHGHPGADPSGRAGRSLYAGTPQAPFAARGRRKRKDPQAPPH
jgi:hypothetical protein